MKRAVLPSRSPMERSADRAPCARLLAAGMVPTRPRCDCALPAVERTVKRDTENKGRLFFSCPRKPWEARCDFFQWAAPPQPQAPPGTTGFKSTRSRVVYRLPVHGGPQRELVEATEFAALVDEFGRKHAMAGGLRCENGCPMTFVCEHSRGDAEVRAHFSHLPQAAGLAPSEAAAPGGGAAPCGCSEEHMYAQYLLVEHAPRIRICRFKSCGKCVEYAFGPCPDAFAEIEVSARNAHGELIRSDVALYVAAPRASDTGAGGQKIATFEVRKTHATDPASRAGDVPYFEVYAEHVIGMLDGANGRSTVTLMCENTTTPCERCAGQQRDRKRPHAGASAATHPEVVAAVEKRARPERREIAKLRDTQQRASLERLAERMANATGAEKRARLERIDEDIAQVKARIEADDSFYGNTSDSNEHSRLQRERFLVENGIPFAGFSPGVVTIMSVRGELVRLSLKTDKVCFGGNVWHTCTPDKLLLVCRGA